MFTLTSAVRTRSAQRVGMLVALAVTLLAVGPVGPAAGAKGNPPRADAARIATAYVRDHAQQLGLEPADVTAVKSEEVVSRHTGMTHVYLAQHFRGLEVFNAVTTVNVASDGSVANVGNRFIGDLAGSVASDQVNRSAHQAIAAAAAHLGLTLKDLALKESKGGPAREQTFNEGGISLDPITAKLVYEPVGDKLRLAWQLEIAELDGEHWWNIRVDAATADVLAKSDYVAHAGYGVFPFPFENPDETAKTLVTDPWLAALFASPFGWHDTNGVAGRGVHDHARQQRVRVHRHRRQRQARPGRKPERRPDARRSTSRSTRPRPVDYAPRGHEPLLLEQRHPRHPLPLRVRRGRRQLPGDQLRRGRQGRRRRQAEAQDGGGSGTRTSPRRPTAGPARMQMYEWSYPFSNEVS